MDFLLFCIWWSASAKYIFRQYLMFDNPANVLIRGDCIVRCHCGKGKM